MFDHGVGGWWFLFSTSPFSTWVHLSHWTHLDELSWATRLFHCLAERELPAFFCFVRCFKRHGGMGLFHLLLAHACCIFHGFAWGCSKVFMNILRLISLEKHQDPQILWYFNGFLSKSSFFAAFFSGFSSCCNQANLHRPEASEHFGSQCHGLDFPSREGHRTSRHQIAQRALDPSPGGDDLRWLAVWWWLSKGF